MADRFPFFAAESGTWRTASPNPHVDLSGTALTLGTYPVQTFAAAAADTTLAFDSGQTCTVTIWKDATNFKRYEGAVWTDAATDTLDLSAATLAGAAGSIANGDSVSVVASMPAVLQPGGALGTPSSGTLTNATGLPVAGVTFAATDTLLGRATTGSGAGEAIACTAAGRELIDDADAAAQRTTLGAAAVITQSAVTITTADVTGAVNTHYLCTIAGLTADRYITLPAGTAGDRIFVTSLNGAATYKLGIKGAASITINDGSAETLDVWLQSADRTFGYEATSATNWQRILGNSEAFELVCSADGSEATTGTDKARFVMPYGFTPKEVITVASKSAPTGSSFLMDVNVGVGGTTLFSTRPGIDATESSSLTGTAAVLNVTWIPRGTIVSVDFDQVGSTLGGKGLIMTLIGVQA